MSEPGHKHGGTEHEGGDHSHGVGRHGMLVVGVESIFVSHLPMFSPAHGVQFIAEVDFEGADDYRKKRRDTGGPIYTLNPQEGFSWRELVADGSEPPKRTSFSADIFKGHFERPPSELILDAETVSVLRVTYVHELSVSELPGRELTYRWVGRGEERFLAHEIHGPPTFDQVLSFAFEDPAFNELELAGAPAVVRDRADTPEQRLRSGETVLAHFFQSTGPVGQHGFSTEITVTDEGYVEIDELKPPPPEH